MMCCAAYLYRTMMLAGLFMAFTHTYAVPSAGSCEGYTHLPLASDGRTIDTAHPLPALRDGVAVYAEADSGTRVDVLYFGDMVKPLEISTSKSLGRIKVASYTDILSVPLGWVERTDLLCVGNLKTETGLERKGFVKTTSTHPDGVPVHRSFARDFTCEPPACDPLKPLGRFELYYIVAEDPDNRRYLLAAHFNLADDKALMGWIDECNLIPWNTTLQLRPKEYVDKIELKPGLIRTDLVMPGYCTEREQLVSVLQGITISGGIEWYKLPYHLPILTETSDSYQVLLPNLVLAQGMFAHVQKDQFWEEETWVPERDLDTWVKLLTALGESNSGNFPVSTQKERFINSMRTQIQELLGSPVLDDTDSGADIETQLKQRKLPLPIRKHSPLLQYTFKQLREMGDCEFVRLIEWVKDISDLLNKVATYPSAKVDFTETPYSDALCPNISNNGKRLTNLVNFTITPFNKDDDTYSYRQDFRGKSVYILPLRFLP